MVRLILIRHAKSSWTDETLTDHQRPLNKRGRGDAPLIGGWPRQNGYLPDLVLCSDSVRTQETCDRLNLGAHVTLRSDLYHASQATIANALRPQEARSVALIGHNMGIGDFAQWLAHRAPDHARFVDYPSAATTVFDLPSWEAIGPGAGQVVDFIIPHDLKG